MKNRKELYDRAREMYVRLIERTAERYFGEKQYVIVDRVGYECTQIEDLLRPLWGIAPFLKEKDFSVNVGGKPMKVCDFINRIMIDGTSADSPRRFDRNVTEATLYSFANQSVTEIAAYLVAVRFAKEQLWDVMSDGERATVAGWIKEWAGHAIRRSWPNNHYWYPIFCIEILEWLGYDCSDVREDVEKGYAFLETLYYGNGWYSDGAVGRFDYYEAWAHHTYTLLWILIADPKRPDYEEKCEKYRRRSEEYLSYFINYFDSDGGMAAYGRSIGYRFAAIAPFGLAVISGCNIDAGLAKRVILRNIDYFFSKSIPTEDGCFPVGYLYSAPAMGESYASDGAISCYTEGLLCLLADGEHPLWTAEESPLPIEKGNYAIQSPLEGLQTVIVGNDRKNGVTLFNNALHYYQDKRFGHTFNDMAGAYSKFAYNSRSGFALSIADRVSADNMISLQTPDGQMNSHRRRITDNYISDGVMVSRHVPFSNDGGTSIKTWMIPLENGYHVRIHKVILAGSYRVAEGGFTVGVTDDGAKHCGNTVKYGDMISSISVECEPKVGYSVAYPQPGMHLLRPQALYPMYETQPLEAGEYVFITTVYFATDGKEEPAPRVTREGSVVSVEQDGRTVRVDVNE